MQFNSKSEYSSVFVEDVGEIQIRPSKRARQMRLAVSARSGIYVVKPRGANEWMVRRFVNSNKTWLKNRLDSMPDKLILPNGERFSRTKTLKITGDSNVRDVVISEVGNELQVALPVEVKFDDQTVQDKIMKHVVKIWRSEAKIYLPKRLARLSGLHGLGYKDVRVKYMHTRWGSCSSANNINLNIQLMRLEPEFIDHVILHELTHTEEHNHSKAFWTLFESIEPGARNISKTLKSYQLF